MPAEVPTLLRLVRAGIVEVVDGQDLAAARADLEALGVVDIKIDRARGVGRAAATSPTVDELCGNCGKGRAAATKPGLVVHMFRHACLHAGAAIAEAAATRLGEIGLHPRVVCQDANAPLPGEYDRLVAMVSVWPVPASWLSALRPGLSAAAAETRTDRHG